MPEACKKCQRMMEEGAVLLSERVKGCLTVVVTFKQVIVQGWKCALERSQHRHGGLKKPGVF